jgi:beta-glucosidase-like glycosyl hydrolase
MDAQHAIARRTVIGLPPDGLSPAWEKDFAAYPPAGVIVFRRDFRDLEDLRRLSARLRALARPRRLFVAMDEEGGFVSQLAGHLVVPPNAMLLGRGAAPGEIEWVSRVTGERLRALGIDWAFAPVADIHSEPSNPVIGPRSFGTDAATVTRCVAEAVRGLSAGGVASCLKHFPGHGNTVLDSHVALPTVPGAREAIERRELVPFGSNLNADAVMAAHVMVPAFDPDRPASLSRAIAHDLLRERLGFARVCITDALEMKGAAAGREPLETARLALEAGCDLLLFAFHDERLRRLRLELARALVAGSIERTRFDAARPRLVRLDQERPEPAAADLARPIDSLTPPDWESRLERIAEGGLVVRGSLPAAARGPWQIAEPGFPDGPAMREDLAALGVPLAEARAAAVHVELVSTRAPLPQGEVGRLRSLCRERPTVLVGLQNDAFLDALPEAALAISASDATPLTRRIVARALAARFRAAAAARA